ncbi:MULTISPECIES: N-acetylmuramoyl-L-alanine amidase [Bacillus]|uniref:N-acetylmuramoyl-L-alanine amidase n=1 Tax=Bacillus TaxID=1386 RepID=UPI000C76B527|nr:MULTISPECIES: N-acetylmuramoyl-L-alanine amidase [Bacillus]PLR86225.1 N-acetylmuramoyl-L-alanine amidase [Bacillus sp. V33-4]RSK49207.1 LysM peptidoglycan-binding domain-containing protein [Bacillus canaveralius]
MVKFFIDPGHGGRDSGASANDIEEKQINLQIALRVQDILLSEYENTEIKMSRTGDQNLSLSERTALANNWGADFLLSIHVNAGGGTGYEDYIYPGTGAPTTTYHNIIHNEVVSATGFRDRGKKQANLHMLRESAMPALLTENGFIDNEADATSLKQASFIERIARGHVNGLARSFNLAQKPDGIATPVVEMYTVRAGDTLSELAVQFGTSVGELVRLNHIRNPDLIRVGERIRVR